MQPNCIAIVAIIPRLDCNAHTRKDVARMPKLYTPDDEQDDYDNGQCDYRGADARTRSSIIRRGPNVYNTTPMVQEDDGYKQPENGVVPRRGSAKLVAPIMLKPTKQPARATRNTEPVQQIKTQQIRIEPKKEQPQRPLSRRGLLTGLITTCAASVAGVGWIGSSLIMTKWSEYQDQLSSGMFPSDSISIVCGHNNDNYINKTELHACVLGEHGAVYFMELPAGEIEKGHVSQLPSLRTLGYQGSLENVSLQLNHIVVGSAHQINLIATCRDVALLAEPLEFEWILTSSKGYFQLAK